MENQREGCETYIQLQFFDTAANQVVLLGGAGFKTVVEGDAAWASIPVFQGESAFIADRLDSEEDIIGEKVVSGEACEQLLGKPIADLMREGREKLSAFLKTVQNPSETV